MCKHTWFYEHTVWNGRSENEIVVGRYCTACGKQQAAFVSMWRDVPAEYEDMRQTLSRPGIRRPATKRGGRVMPPS